MAGAPRLRKGPRPAPDSAVFMSGVPQVPLDSLLTSVFPSLPSNACSAVKAQLTDHLVRDAWTAFKAENTSRKDPMKALQSIFDAVVGVATDMFADVLGPRQTELDISSCELSISEYLPHAEFRLMSQAGNNERPWFSTVIPWRLDTDAYDPKSNHYNLIWNCHDVLREDPRRRFTFGVTLDADEMRLWFFSRSHNVVSEPFNFNEEPDALIRLFLAIGFATPEHLGYDTSMSYFIDGSGSVQFKLSLDGAMYITKRLLSDNRSDLICGRATRVWDAYREDDPNRKSVVIKDLWTSVDVVPEGTQLLDLHVRLQALEAPGTPRLPGDYFLTVVAHGFVQTTDGVDDHTVDVMMNGHTFEVPSANHRPRKHYRIVFKERGVSLDRLRTMSEIFQALADATRALSLLHRLGFVHRDVSAGNILLVDGIGKLADLEYLETFEGPVSHVCLPGIGTPEYTSVEVAWNNYIWMPSPATMPIVEKPPKEEEFVLPPFRFNPLHDLESTLWIGFWALLYHQRHDDFQARTLERYFHERPSDQRIDTVSRMVAIKSGFPCAPADGPSVPATDVLNILRRRLLDHYIAFEQDFDPRFGLLRTPTLVTPLEAAQDFIVQYETAGSLFRNVLPATPAKREPTNDLDPEESHSSVPPSVSPAGRSKKNGSATKKSVNSNKTSPGSRKVRSTGLHASRRSSRIAARKKNLKPSGGSK